MSELEKKKNSDKPCLDSYVDQLDKLIELKKKENNSLKTIVEVMTKNQKKSIKNQ